MSDLSASISQNIAVPAYFDPVISRGDWDRLDNGAPAVSFAVINPSNGPSPSPDIITRYVDQVQRSHDAALIILGYVDTNRTDRSVETVKADITTYYTRYTDADGNSVLDGIFFDRVTNDCTDPTDPASHLAYYQDLANFVKSFDSNALVVLNPGIFDPALPQAGECYIGILPDIILVAFEGFAATYLAGDPTPGWVSTYPPDHFWHIIHHTNEADLQTIIDLSKQRNAGFVYVTSTGPTNEFDALPMYFEREVQLENQ